MTKQAFVADEDFWERSAWLWSVMFYLGLLVPAILPFTAPASAYPRQLIVLAVVINGLWHAAGVMWLPRRFPNFRQYPAIMLAYLLVAVGLWLWLVQLHPAFFWTTVGLFGQIYFFLPFSLSVPFAALFMLLIMYQTFATDGAPFNWRSPVVWGSVLGIVAGGLFAYWIRGVIAQSGERRELLQALQAAQADLALSERRAGILQERQRLAHEIHDTLAQGFISIVMHLEAVDQALAPEQAQERQHIARAMGVARDSLRQARRVIADLRPERLEQATLVEALQQLVAEWQAETAVKATVQVTGREQLLPSQIEIALLRATQEALANVRKHAQAGLVTVTLSFFDELLLLDVQDNGVGFNDTAVANRWQGGFGLTAMRERLARFHGELEIESETGEGTTITVSIPLTAS